MQINECQLLILYIGVVMLLNHLKRVLALLILFISYSIYFVLM